MRLGTSIRAVLPMPRQEMGSSKKGQLSNVLGHQDGSGTAMQGDLAQERTYVELEA